MSTHRVLISNMGYARDIDGSAATHLSRSWRNIYTPLHIQKTSLDAYRRMMDTLQPDLCCMIEIDSGSFSSGGLDQFSYLTHPDYPYRDIVSKYSANSKLQRFPLTRGKSNGWMARKPYHSERIFLTCGSKRLVYRIALEEKLTLFFTHLALGYATRTQQLKEIRELADREEGEVLIAGDFNIFAGLEELDLFTGDGRYFLLNHPEDMTFTMFGRHYQLDLCLVNDLARPRTQLQIIDQPFSDHDALLVTIAGPA